MASTRQTSTPPTSVPAGTIIGPGIQVHGRISGEEDLSVQGRIEGSVHLTETLYVSHEGVVVAEVRARDVVVGGTIVGHVFAEDSVTLEPGSKVVGDISAPRVIISAGAAFRGRVSMGGATPPAPRAQPRRTTAVAPKAKAAPPRPRAATPPAAPVARSARAAAAVAAETTTTRSPSPRVPAARQEALISEAHDDETVVIRHAELDEIESDHDEEADATTTTAASQSKKKAKKVPRVPKPGKRRVTRRS